ncbi:Mov34/MPN/PAD-1 family protein [Paenibacillus barcinonensis]|uniref:JAB domain-containing protein similar to deubiquitination enzymes n=1 Tax=Paenibacillus barcinonensis TaxID=198119 RepID=A0A2V4VXA0_PAEBA|nr:Mov34/MPN/PAD-1 family protein [Paenibacillus barcinonensis]PYE52365.1 JAB domain-containing protein similar to deubiquitination enzymes [Paenibacillus barcinonensis]QKS59519.1 Mov34/MPN/PAD-1 family protein [Paenibacillus barcinonensis]
MAALHGQQNTLTIPCSVEQEMSRHMHLSLPQEACGVVLGESAAGGIRISRFQPIRNVAPDPLHHFTLDQTEWIRCIFSGSTIVGIFHTHPHTTPTPSHEDLQALPDFGGMVQVYLIGSPNPDTQSSCSNPNESPSRMLMNAYQIATSNHQQPSNAASKFPSVHLIPMELRVT